MKNIDLVKKVKDVSSELNDVSSQLDTKANEIKSLNDNKMDKNTKDISVTQINKNLGKFDETYMSESLLAKMTGEGTFGTVPEDKSKFLILFNKLSISSAENLRFFISIYFSPFLFISIFLFIQLFVIMIL